MFKVPGWRLEGKKHVEQYVQKLTHEIKSPLSAIRGPAELLDEKMPAEQQARFLSNIRHESNRIQEMVDRMLELSSLENQKILEKMESLSFSSIAKTVVESKRPMLSQKNVRLVDRIRQKTRRTRGDSLAKIIEDLNPTVHGWFHYFKHAQSVSQLGVDGFIRRRLRAILREQEKRPGMGRCFNDHLRWPNTYFAAQGLFTITAARVLASQSR